MLPVSQPFRWLLPTATSLAVLIGLPLAAPAASLFRAPFTAAGVPGTPEYISARDLDGDGKVDLVISARFENGFTVLMGLGGGVFAAPATYSLTSYGSPPIIADVTGDGEKESEASVRIFDTSGRLVRTLAQGRLGIGEHSARWDRSTDGGARATPGIYFCELRAGDRRAVTRIVLL
ncbi:MAG TPA: FG-GAP-like repeat-containing protein [Candidatus Eisenbacteria bacterium]|nr:FG-GAP-like repeat-containing protein [Candidatus Eisenbacteria bacterium]